MDFSNGWKNLESMYRHNILRVKPTEHWNSVYHVYVTNDKHCLFSSFEPWYRLHKRLLSSQNWKYLHCGKTIHSSTVTYLSMSSYNSLGDHSTKCRKTALDRVLMSKQPKLLHFSHVQYNALDQWWRDLFRCRIDPLNFSMRFNIIAPYLEFLHMNWCIAEWD